MAKNHDEDHRYSWLSPLWIASAALVFICVVFLAWIIIGKSTPKPTPSASEPASRQTSTSIPSSDPTAASGTASASPTSDVAGCIRKEQAEGPALVVAPQDTKWEIVEALAIPKSASAGPLSAQNGTGLRCYSPTSEGALLAAANIFLRSSGPRGDVFRKTGWSPELSQERQQTLKAGGIKMQVVGFKFSGPIVNNEVSLSLLLETNVDKKVFSIGAPLVARWTGNDWVLRGDKIGQTENNPSGFMTWRSF